MAMTGSSLQVYVTVDGVQKGVDQNGGLVSGSGFQFSSPHDAVAALQIAVDSSTGAMASFKCVHTPA